MKQIISLMTILFFSFSAIAQSPSVYTLQLNDINGTPISLGSFQGKKILFCLIPLNASNNEISQIDSISKKYSNKIKIVGIPSIEDGYSDSSKQDIKNIYESRNINILLTEGMYTKSSSGTNQSNLISWLTKKELNQRFNFSVNGIGQKFFIDSNGKLLGSLDPNVTYLSTSVKNLIFVNQ